MEEKRSEQSYPHLTQLPLGRAVAAGSPNTTFAFARRPDVGAGRGLAGFSDVNPRGPQAWGPESQVVGWGNQVTASRLGNGTGERSTVSKAINITNNETVLKFSSR